MTDIPRGSAYNRNAWTRYYESTLPRRRESRRESRVVQSEKQAPKVLRGAEKQIAEDNAQFRRYNRAKAAEYKAALTGPNGDIIKQIHNKLKYLDIEQADTLINSIAKWNWETTSLQERYVVISMIDDAIIRVREQNGLAPFDDAIFDEEPTVFQICKTKLGVP